MVQEYGRYFQMPTVVCAVAVQPDQTIPASNCTDFSVISSSAISKRKPIRSFGYKGKQVRDNIHSLDVVRFISEFIRQPRIGEVYNLGGGRENSISILEAFDLIARILRQADVVRVHRQKSYW